jgi:hypothetical protein
MAGAFTSRQAAIDRQPGTIRRRSKEFGKSVHGIVPELPEYSLHP